MLISLVGGVLGTSPAFLLKTSRLFFSIRIFNLYSMEVCHGSVACFKSRALAMESFVKDSLQHTHIFPESKESVSVFSPDFYFTVSCGIDAYRRALWEHHVHSEIRGKKRFCVVPDI